MTLLPFVLLVGIAAACALVAIAASRNCAQLHAELVRMLSAVSTERSLIEKNEARIEEVSDQLHRLRGKFYAERRQSSETVDTPPKSAADLKAELRKQLGLMPGRR